MKEVWVLGAGTMGNGIAHVFALNSWKVLLYDVNENQLKKAISTISNNLERQIKKGIISPEQKEKTLNQITITQKLKEGTPYLIIEAVFEDYEVKASILKELNSLIPSHTIVGTNTSSIPISRLASNVNNSSRFLGVHFMNPVPVMKLVEIIRGMETSEEIINEVIKIINEIGKTPVVVNDYPGFVSNRVLLPMINEAIYALYEGVAGPNEIDTVMQLGMNHPMGPLHLADFIGLDVCLNILNVLYEGFKKEKYAPCPLLQKLVWAGHLGVKTGSGFYIYENGQKKRPAPYLRQLSIK